MAELCSGLCPRCHVLLQHEFVRTEGGARCAIVEKFGERNHMDPVWNFPHEELASLFQAATLTESMFVALEHMQVNFVTASKRTRVNKFRKNVISFAQDTPAFAQRVGLMCRYERGDRVNTRRGPGMPAGTVGKHSVSARDAEKHLLVCDELG